MMSLSVSEGRTLEIILPARYAALCRKKILTFIDNSLRRGEEICSSLLKAIEESKLSVIVFSGNYASSRWCLDELVKILECKKMNGQTIIPVFYQVNPSHVRNQTETVGDSIGEHELLTENMEKGEEMESCLEVATLTGWDSR